MEKVAGEPYYELIEMIYFEEKTREEIAEYYDRDITTIWRNILFKAPGASC